MSDNTPGRPKRLFEMIDELLTRRDDVFRLIILIVVAAASLNILTGLLGSWAWEKYGSVWWLWTIPGLVLFLCVIWAIQSYAGRITKQMHFEILFPFRRETSIKAVQGKYYKPLVEFEHRVGKFFKETSDVNAAIAAEWKNNIIEKDRRSILHSHSPNLMRFLNDLAEFFIFDTVSNFSKKSLSSAARFMRYGWIRPNYKKPTIFKSGEGLSPLEENLIFQQTPKLVPRSLKFLRGFKFQRNPLKKIEHGKDQKKKDSGYFEFTSVYGSLRFTISPFPIILNEGDRDAHLVSRYCDVKLEELMIIKVPFMMTIDFRGLMPLRKQFRDEFAPWIEDLVDAIGHNLDWQHCAQHDMERMVIELLQHNS